MTGRPGQLEVRDGSGGVTGNATVVKAPGVPVVNGVATLGDSAALDVGVASGEIAAGDDARFAGWWPQGTVIRATTRADEGNVGEPSVIYRTDPQLLSGYSGCFAMWHTGGWGSPSTYYQESPDGLPGTWTRYASAVIPTSFRNCVVYDPSGDYYHAFVSPGTDTSIVHYKSANGVTGWTLVGTVVSAGGGGWRNNNVANSGVVIDGGTWYLLFDGFNGTFWRVGLMTSTDGGNTWMEYGSNPVIDVSGDGDGVSQPHFMKVGSTFYAWCQRQPGGVIPSDLHRYSAPTPHGPWVQDTSAPVYPRTTADEGVRNATGQMTGRILEVDGRCYYYHTVDRDGTLPSGESHIKLAICNLTLSQLVQTSEGVNGAALGVSARAGWPELLEGVFAYRNASQSIPNTTATAIAFDQENNQTGGVHSTSTNPSHFTAPVAGKYSLTCSVYFTGNATGFRQLFVQKNGVAGTYYALSQQDGSANGNALSVSVVGLRLEAGDYLEVLVYQSSGGALNVQFVNNRIPGAGFQLVSR